MTVAVFTPGRMGRSLDHSATIEECSQSATRRNRISPEPYEAPWSGTGTRLRITTRTSSLEGFENDDIGLHTYHEKSSVISEGVYQLSRQKWAESRKIAWNVKNKRPEKLKDNLSEVEVLLQANQVVQVRWRNPRFVQVLLSNIALVSLMIAKHTGDVEKIFIDKSLCAKLTDKIYTGVWSESFMLLSFCDKSKICYIHFTRKFSSEFKKLERLAALEPKITYLDLPGHAGRRLNRRLAMNTKEDMIGIWWSAATEEAWPWSPVPSDRARANMIVVGLQGGKVDVLAFLRTECDPIYASFSQQNPQHILTIEFTPNNAEDTSVDSCTYEINEDNVRGPLGVPNILEARKPYATAMLIYRVSVTSIPLKAAVSCQAWNEAEDKLLLGCKDKSLVLYDCHRLLTQITNISFIPVKIRWHPCGSLAFVFSLHGDIQVFDMALAPICFQLAAESRTNSTLPMTQYLTDVKLAHVQWSCDVPLHTVMDSNIACHDNLLLVFQDRGVLCNLRVELGSMTEGRLGARELCEEYIKHNQAEQAVNFVNSINWNNDGNTCFACLSAVMNYLLKFPLTDNREGLLEETLGCFYTPSRPLTDMTVLQFRDPLSRWSRRFFYHLLRYRRLQKAFMLAVDIGAADLFMDLHFMAMDAGNISLAENAKNKALEIDSELISTDTDGSVETDDDESLSSAPQEPAGNPQQPQKPIITQERKPEMQNMDSVDGQGRNVVEDVESNGGSLLPIQGNITQDQAVWELANNIELVTTETEEDVIYL